MSSETYINVFFTKFSHNVDDLVLEGLCKFQVNEPINARVLAVQSLGNLHTFIYCGSHDGGQRNAHQPIFPYNVIENSLTSFACNFVFIGPNNFKFGAK